jgi:hypothetical protein
MGPESDEERRVEQWDIRRASVGTPDRLRFQQDRVNEEVCRRSECAQK